MGSPCSGTHVPSLPLWGQQGADGEDRGVCQEGQSSHKLFVCPPVMRIQPRKVTQFLQC